MKQYSNTLILIATLAIFTTHSSHLSAANSAQNLADSRAELTYTIKETAEVPKGIKNAVLNNLFYTEYAQDMQLEGEVYLYLTVDNDNRLEIVRLKASDRYLGKYVKEQLNSTIIKNPGCNPGDTYMMKVNFDLSNENI